MRCWRACSSGTRVIPSSTSGCCPRTSPGTRSSHGRPAAGAFAIRSPGRRFFFLPPPYISWYPLVPRQAGGRLFSDPLARTSFILFLLLSTPIGFHHQYTDPGIHEGWKLGHAFLTFTVFFPSLLTFLNVVASLESGARARGGRGLVAWFGRLPWGEATTLKNVLAMLLFAFGGVGGLINASF